MPLVMLKYKQGLLEPKQIRTLGPRVQEIVARALNCRDRGGELTPDHIDVEFYQNGEYDITKSSLRLIILANEYPKRMMNLDERVKRIAKDFRQELGFPDRVFEVARGFVWLPPFPNGFARI